VSSPRASLGIAALLIRSAAIFARNLPAIAVLALLVFSPLLVLGALATPARGADPRAAVRAAGQLTLIYTVASTLGALVLTSFLSGAVVHAVVHDLRGARSSWWRSTLAGVRRLWPVLGVGTMAALCIVFGLVTLAVPGLLVLCLAYVALPAAVIERPGVIGALHRSAALTQGYRWQIAELLLLVAAIEIVAWLVLHQLLVVPIHARAPLVPNPASWTTYRAITTGVLMVGGAFGAVVSAVTYAVLRERRDGAGPDRLAQALE